MLNGKSYLYGSWDMQTHGGTLYILPQLIKNNTLKLSPDIETLLLCQRKSMILLELVKMINSIYLSMFPWVHNPQCTFDYYYIIGLFGSYFRFLRKAYFSLSQLFRFSNSDSSLLVFLKIY